MGWKKPVANDADAVKLKVYNTLTKKKEEFIPARGKEVLWYGCGPTVYDASHLGHARNYITSDILRRVMEDYFNYDVHYVMNITDVDDKIIIAARQKFLFDRFLATSPLLTPSLLSDVRAALENYLQNKLGVDVASANVVEGWEAEVEKLWSGFEGDVAEKGKREMQIKVAGRAVEALRAASVARKEGKTGSEEGKKLIVGAREAFSDWIDAQQKAEVTKPEIFREFAAFWEDDFFKDMDVLNVRRPDLLTRVSEYIPEIIAYVQKIIENGYGYESNGSVYFNTVTFGDNPTHDYPKLVPGAKGNSKLLADGEGALTDTALDKRDLSDFALWKKSREGEPEWDSPWGKGRPGWHIECSVMASEVLGHKLDVHSGGIDLAFPHHDNEMAQAEAYYENEQWVNYFLHSGHLHIEGQKMSKSLKNFITIQQALERHSATKIRLMFLLNSWSSILDYSERSLEEAEAYEGMFNNFLREVSATIREAEAHPVPFTGNHNFHDEERQLFDALRKKQERIHAAICDNFDMPQVMLELKELIAATNTYRTSAIRAKRRVQEDLLKKVAKYVVRMLRTFGVIPESGAAIVSSLKAEVSGASGAKEDIVMPYVRVLSNYRDGVRALAQQGADSKEFLKLSDKLRDEDLIELDIQLDDREDGKALAKFMDKATILREREEKRQRELKRQQEKEERAREALRKQQEELEKGKTAPADLFKDAESLTLYSKWDEKGIPTHDADGAEVAKSKKKRLQKEYDVQVKLHDKYKAWVYQNGGK
ncbi:tRNA synthetases class I (C) catalytic domain-containing protein [Cladochytrium replicatum]|nr:tRNA synthetases class I (C) catalytic domain-containing protein [Cladochytrium replicatum]